MGPMHSDPFQDDHMLPPTPTPMKDARANSPYGKSMHASRRPLPVVRPQTTSRSMNANLKSVARPAPHENRHGGKNLRQADRRCFFRGEERVEGRL